MHIIRWTSSLTASNLTNAVAAAANRAFSESYSEDSLFYVVAFGILANVVIAAACVTTLAFVRSSSSSRRTLHNNTNSADDDKTSVTAKKRISAITAQGALPNHEVAAVSSSSAAVPAAAVAPDVYRVLAPAGFASLHCNKSTSSLHPQSKILLKSS